MSSESANDEAAALPPIEWDNVGCEVVDIDEAQDADMDANADADALDGDE